MSFKQLDLFENDLQLNKSFLEQAMASQGKVNRKVFASMKKLQDDIEYISGRLQDLMLDFDKIHPPE
jgi:hypothetical protein